MRVSSGRTHWGLLAAVATWVTGLDRVISDEPRGAEAPLVDRSCYRFRGLDGARFSAANPAQCLSSELGPDGLSLQVYGDDRTTLSHRLAAWGRDGALRPLVGVSPVSSGDQVEVRRRGLFERHEDLLEWYGNDTEGLDLGILVPDPPHAKLEHGPLVLELRLFGDLVGRVSGDGRAVAFLRGGTVPLLYYRDLRVADAHGRELDASLELKRRVLQIRIEDGAATYPLLVV